MVFEDTDLGELIVSGCVFLTSVSCLAPETRGEVVHSQFETKTERRFCNKHFLALIFAHVD